jgi:ADP-heptose:LPS heptosyltransferase
MTVAKRCANFLWWLFILRPIDHCAQVTSRKTDTSRVLVAFPARIGDSVIWLDGARAIREIYPAPQWHITLLSDPAFASLAAMQPQFDSVWEFDRVRYWSSPLYRFRMDRQMAVGDFSVVINPAPWPDQYHVDSVVSVSAARTRVGWYIESERDSRAARIMRRWRARQYTKTFNPPAPARSMFQLNECFVRALGARSFKAHSPVLVVDRRLAQVAPNLPFYVLCPGASEPIKRWPVENFAKLADGIFSATGAKGVVCGSNGDAQLARDLCSQVHAPIVNLTGQLNLAELAALFTRASLVIANDSGPFHVAAASGAPALCVLGDGSFGWCAPYDVSLDDGRSPPRAIWHEMDCYKCDWECIYHPPDLEPAPCIANVKVERVTSEALALMRERASTGR